MGHGRQAFIDKAYTFSVLVRTLTVGGPSAGAWQKYPAKVEAAQVAVLAFRASGEFAQLIAREGDKVSSDQLVAKLDDKDHLGEQLFRPLGRYFENFSRSVRGISKEI